MGLVLNMVGSSGSGGGGLVSTEAVVTVTLDTGSTVTMTKGGESLTPVSWTQAADANALTAIFTVQSSMFDSQNAWTLTATDGVATVTQNLTVSAALVYAVDLRMWTGQLYTDGNQWTRITGGFDTVKALPSGTYTLNTIDYGEPPNGVITMSNPQNRTSCAITLNTVDVTSYNYLNIKFESNNYISNRLYLGVRATNTDIDVTSSAGWSARMAINASATGVQTLNIGALAGAQYIAIGGYNASTTTCSCTISEWYMSVNPPT